MKTKGSLEKKNRTFSHALLCCLVFFSTIILFRRWCRWLWWGCRSSRWLAPWLVPVPHRIFRVACLYRDVFIVLIINGFSLSLSLSLSLLKLKKNVSPNFFHHPIVRFYRETGEAIVCCSVGFVSWFFPPLPFVIENWGIERGGKKWRNKFWKSDPRDA